MNQRERTLSLLLLGGIFLGGGGFFGYQFVLGPLRDANRQIDSLQGDIEVREGRVLEIQQKLATFYEPLRKLSLPADVMLAGLQYEVQLSALLRRADFQAGSFTITPRQPDAKNAPVLVAKKTAYTRLAFLVQVKGELHCLVDFLDQFYRQPLLHQIRVLNVTRPSRAGERSRREDLDINMTIEALVLDNAEARGTLIHVPPRLSLLGGNLGAMGIGTAAVYGGKGSPYELERGAAKPADQMGRLAIPPREYAAITGKNVFFGPPPKKEPPKDETPKEPDLGPYIRLTALSATDGHGRAHIFDFYNQFDYHIEQKLDGTIGVEGFYFIKDRRRSLMRSREAEKGDLEFGDRGDGNYVRLRVLKVADSNLYVQLPEADAERKARLAAPVVVGGTAVLVSSGKMYRWEIGKLLSEMTLMTPAEVRAELPEFIVASAAEKGPRPR